MEFDQSSTITARRYALDRRRILYLILVAAALLFLGPQLAGLGKVMALLQQTQPMLLLFTLFAETLRYAAAALTTRTLAGMFGAPPAFVDMFQTMLASAAANRTLSAGGIAGMLVRYDFLTKQKLPGGAVAAIMALENLMGTLLIAVVFSLGLSAIVLNRALGLNQMLAAITFLAGCLAFAGTGIYLYRRRALLEHIVHALALFADKIAVRLLGRHIYARRRLQRAVNDFYAGVHLAREHPGVVARALGFNALRLMSDALALYCAFLAIGYSIHPGVALVTFTASNALSAISAAPAEAGVMEASLAFFSTMLGVPLSVATVTILLFRAISYWLPIPVGYAAFWNLRRRGLV
jgi:uncharacterized protein (TIRG00374 family)